MWSSDRPTPEQLETWRRRMSPPENEFPAGAGLTSLFARTGDAAVGITHVEAFSTGFAFTLAVRLRRPHPGLFMLISGHGRPGVAEVPVQRRLLLGLEYADGRRASTLDDRRLRGPRPELDDRQLVLTQEGGGGGDQSVDQRYWVSPLPSAGPVTFVLAWAAFGMPESRTVVDGSAILAAAERSQPLWPPQPAEDPPEPPPAPRPSTGWFADPENGLAE